MAEASCSLRIALAISSIALILTIVGLASPYWLSDKIGHSGLWKTCITMYMKKCFSFKDLPGDGYPGWLKAVQAVEIIGTVIGAGAITAILLCAFVEYIGRNKLSHIGAMLANYLAAGFVLLGVIIYVSKCIQLLEDLHTDISLTKFLSWAFALNIVGGVGFLASGLVMICDVRQRWYL